MKLKSAAGAFWPTLRGPPRTRPVDFPALALRVESGDYA